MKFPQSAYDSISPLYELRDDGLLYSRATGEQRPKLYSGLPVPFKKGDITECVDGTWQFPLGNKYVVDLIEGDVVYVHEVGEKVCKAICWERLDLVAK